MKPQQQRILLAGLCLCMIAAPLIAGESVRFAHRGKAIAESTVGTAAVVRIYANDSEDGIRLYNVSDSSVTVQDTVTLDTLTLAPGMQLGLSCNAERHLAVSSGRDVVYHSVHCGSELRVMKQGGQQ